MNCKNVQTLLSAYLDEELSGREMLNIREHLNGCSDCSQELSCVQGVKRLLGGTSVPEPSADFEERLVAHVLAVSPVSDVQKKMSWLTLTGIAAASMLATMLVLNSIHHEPPVSATQADSTPYDVMRQERGIDFATDPLSGSPVMLPMRDRR